MQKTHCAFFRAFAFGAVLFSLTIVSQAQVFTAGTAHCRFAVPAILGKGRAQWMGECAHGQAMGYGVIRLQPVSGAVPHLFYGLLQEGIPQTGVLQLAEDQWQPVWHFDAQRNVVNNDAGDMQVSIDAFRAASRGAREASTRYSAAGNKTSAAYYARLATRFDKQMNE